MTIQLHCLIPPKWVISCSLTFAFETFDNWWKHWVKRYQLILLIIEICPHQLRLVSCPTIILWTQPTRLITVSRIWPSTIINMYHLTHSSAPTNSSYFTSSHPQQSQPTSHQTSFKKKSVPPKKGGPSWVLMVRNLTFSATSRRLPNRVAKDVHQLKETEDIVWILTICFQLSETKNRSGFFLEERVFFGYVHHVQPGKNPMAAEGQQWLASNWGGDHNTENQQFHGEEHHDQCEHLRIGELLAFGFTNGRTLLRLKEMVHHKIPWSRGKSMAVKILRP